MRAAHIKAVACRSKALPYLQPAGVRVDIPFEDTYFRGILRKPAGIEKPPLVIMCMGLDSAKEETDAYEAPFLARGMAVLAFDGPGQGESEYELGIRGDYEVAVREVVDWVEKRSDVDKQRIGLWGGYRWAAITRGALPHLKNASRHVFHCRGRSTGRQTGVC